MRRRLFWGALLCLPLLAARADAITRPAPGTDPTLPGSAMGMPAKALVGVAICVAAAAVAVIWWYRSRKRGPGGGA